MLHTLMKSFQQFINENFKISRKTRVIYPPDMRIKLCEKIRNWFSIDKFPKLNERLKIQLDDGWYFVISHIEIMNSEFNVLSAIFERGNKQYMNFTNKTTYSYSSYNQEYSYMNIAKKIVHNIKTYNNWYGLYVIDNPSLMDDAEYVDKNFKNVETISINDIK